MIAGISSVVAPAIRHPGTAAAAAAAALAVAFVLWRAAWRVARAAREALRGRPAEDVLTIAAATLATAVAMTGMWRFFGNVLHFSGVERVTMFAFLELAMVTSAFRGRRNMREFASSGAEGATVWALSILSAVFSSLDAGSGIAAVFRLAPPLVAAWLWERGLSLERRRVTGRAIHWRLTAERALVWLGLAEPAERAASEVDAHRRIARLARAVKRLRQRRDSWAWRKWLARRRLDAAMERAVEHAQLASDPARQDEMRDQLGALNGAEALVGLDAPAPWDRRASEAQAAAEAAEIQRQAGELAEAAERARAQAVSEARRVAEAAEARSAIAARDALRARGDAERIQETAAARVQALEESRTDLRARAELAERELADARMRAAELSEELAHARAHAGSRAGAPARTHADACASGPAHAHQNGDAGRADGPGRAALVASLAAEILAGAAAGQRWQPDYAALMKATGRGRRWCEYVVRDARSAVFTPGGDARTDSAADSARAPHAESPHAPHAERRAEPPAGADADGAALAGVTS